jgi:trk system potassium uptake protein TrkH
LHAKVVSGTLGLVLAAAGGLMLIPALYSLAVGDGAARAFFLPALPAMAFGSALFLLVRSPNAYVSLRDVFLIVALGWLEVAALGALPFLLSGLMGPVNAFFESMAGFTTTGASTVRVPEEVAPSLLLWRSLCQWAGGIGIVVLFVAVGPLVGFGTAQLYSAEVANPVPERLTPRIRDTAKTLAFVYLALTLGGVLALLLAGMDPFDAVNHALTTVSTGGYSTRSDSIAAFDSWAVELAITAGMLLSGANFALYYWLSQGRFRRVLENPELRAYLGFVIVGAAVMTASLYALDYQESILFAFREALFQSVSLLTGTAFTTADWGSWDPLSQVLLILFMSIGACAGSTSGGLKVIRAILLFQHGRQQAFRMLHPQAVMTLRLGSQVIPEQLRVSVLGFFFIYVMTLAVGTVLLSLQQVPVGEAFGSVFACLNITGAFVGGVGSAEFYAGLPPSARLTLTGFMLLGRLELFTVLVVLTPAFWTR